jgi:hypothetical protein
MKLKKRIILRVLSRILLGAIVNLAVACGLGGCQHYDVYGVEVRSNGTDQVVQRAKVDAIYDLPEVLTGRAPKQSQPAYTGESGEAIVRVAPDKRFALVIEVLGVPDHYLHPKGEEWGLAERYDGGEPMFKVRVHRLQPSP